LKPRKSGLPSPTLIKTAQLATNPRSNLGNLLQINAGVHTQTVEGVDKVLRRDIPSCALGVRAATETANAAVKYPDPVFQSHNSVNQSLAICVMEVKRKIRVRDAGCLDGLQELEGAGCSAHTRGVGNGHLIC